MKRFWKIVSVERVDGGYAICLDGRPVKTPMRADLLLHSAALAEGVAQEWRDVGDKIDPAAMPITGFANAAIDRVARERDSFVDAIAGYGETDCFCYRADGPTALIQRQAERWDPWLDWAATRYDVAFVRVAGIMHSLSQRRLYRCYAA